MIVIFLHKDRLQQKQPIAGVIFITKVFKIKVTVKENSFA